MAMGGGGRERGSIAVWASVSMVAFVVCVGAGVDLAGHAGAEQHARSVAREAARAGAQFLMLSEGGRPGSDTRRAVAAAESYVESSSLTGTARLDGGYLWVDVAGSYDTLFLGIIGVDRLPVHGSAAAGALAVVAGAER